MTMVGVSVTDSEMAPITVASADFQVKVTGFKGFD